MTTSYFLGANAPGGFYSLYSELLPAPQGRAIYILKGGPGCGKSTLMRRVGAELAANGLDTEYILCSGDPDSLDGLVLPQVGAALVDGTSPHIVEPALPGAVECYVNLGESYNRQALSPLREQLESCMSGYKACYRRAYRCLDASAGISEDLRAIITTEALCAKLAKRAKGILSREVPRHKQASPGQIRQRFLGAVTHKGRLCLFDTVLSQCSRVYALADRYGLAHELLVHLLPEITASGYDVIACPDPMFPDRLAHLLIPQLHLAFVSSTPTLPFPGTAYRRIRLDGAIDSELLQHNRPRFRFSQKISTALMEEAIACLEQAKTMHDRLEALYNPHVNFDYVEQTAAQISAEILSLRS